MIWICKYNPIKNITIRTEFAIKKFDKSPGKTRFVDASVIFCCQLDLSHPKYCGLRLVLVFLLDIHGKLLEETIMDNWFVWVSNMIYLLMESNAQL